MIDQLKEIVELRFKDRDSELNSALLTIKQTRAAKGVFYSGGTIKASHDILIKELKLSGEIIVESVVNVLELNNTLKVPNDLVKFAHDILTERKRSLEGIYRSQMKVVFDSLQNKSIIASYSNLDEHMLRAQKELTIYLNKAESEFEKRTGINLTQRIKNRFLDQPLIAIAVVVATAIIAILGFINIFK